MSTNDEQYEDPEEVQDEEAELDEDDLDEAAGGDTGYAPGDDGCVEYPGDFEPLSPPQ